MEYSKFRAELAHYTSPGLKLLLQHLLCALLLALKTLNRPHLYGVKIFIARRVMSILGTVEVQSGQGHPRISYRRGIKEYTNAAKYTGGRKDGEKQPVHDHCHVVPVSLLLKQQQKF